MRRISPGSRRKLYVFSGMVRKHCVGCTGHPESGRSVRGTACAPRLSSCGYSSRDFSPTRNPSALRWASLSALQLLAFSSKTRFCRFSTASASLRCVNCSVSPMVCRKVSGSMGATPAWSASEWSTSSDRLLADRVLDH